MKTFQQLGVSSTFLPALAELGITKPTEIQAAAIPFLMDNGGDLVAQAQTGTGKTAAFGLPLLAKIDPKLNAIQALVVAPTRELAKQIGKQLFRFTKGGVKIFVEVVCGGDKMDVQISRLQRPTHIVVATPGRLIDLLQRKALSLAAVTRLVLDEADEMLKMGFKKELLQIFQQTPARSSTWLFSATIPAEIRDMAREFMSSQVHSLKIDKTHVVNRDISHRYLVCTRDKKTDCVADFLRRQKEGRGLIFCNTKAAAIELTRELAEKGFPVDVLQGDLPQLERDKVMRAFKKERVQFLIATDVAARGIDVENLSFVLHHQLPDELAGYTHRSGRTARAGKKGTSFVLIEPRERARLKRLESKLGLSFIESR